jgi:RHS repeat-associated protein
MNEKRQSHTIMLDHDARGYLVAATRPDGSAEVRAPDAVGNLYRTHERTDRVYAPGGRLAEADGARYVHDEDGQLVETVTADGRRWRYAWDLAGQLVEVTRPDGQRVSFAYDALGRRVRKTFAGRTTRFVWDGNVLVHELAEASEAVTWVFEPGTFAPLAKMEGGKRYGVVTDHLGTPKMMADEAGALAWKAQLDVYGVTRNDVALTGCPWRWPGQYEDEETGLFYNRFRYYDPEAGRYVCQDPIGLVGGLRLYGYVIDSTLRGDPLGLIDPWDIQYSQDSISGTFQHGSWAGSTLDDAIEATAELGQLPEGLQLSVVDMGDAWVTLNNRTLYVAQEAGLAQVHPTVADAAADNQLNKLLGDHGPLEPGEQPRIRGCK